MKTFQTAIAAALLSLSVASAADDPITTKSGALSAPPAGKGLVVFFRPGSMMGMALGCTIHEADGELARLGAGKYYAVAAAPGKHEYFTKGERTDRLTREVDAGDTYYVKCNIGMGIAAGRANLSPSDRDAFAKKAKGLSLWKGKGDDAAASPS